MAHYNLRVAYIHPVTPTFVRAIIPCSIPALIKRIENEGYKVRGYFAEGISKKTIKDIDVAIIDIHWHLSLRGARKLAKKLKKYNPEMTIIAGGLTASNFYVQILRDFDVDYIIVGDGEPSISALLDYVRNRECSVLDIPNVVSKQGDTVSSIMPLTQTQFDSNEYYNLEFFPSLEEAYFKLNKCFENTPLTIYPTLVVFRGCPAKFCGRCVGSETMQEQIFNRGSLVRAADRVKDDLNLLEKKKEARKVSIYHDFITLLPESYSLTVLSRRYNLKVLYEFANLPTQEHLDVLMDSFNGGVIVLFLTGSHANDVKIHAPDILNERIAQIKKDSKYTPILVYDYSRAKTDKNYLYTAVRVIWKTKCSVYNAEEYWDLDIYGSREYKEMLLKKLMKKSSGKTYWLSNFLVKIMSFFCRESWGDLKLLVVLIYYDIKYKLPIYALFIRRRWIER